MEYFVIKSLMDKLDAVLANQNQILSLLNQQQQENTTIMFDLTALQTAVAAANTQEASVEALCVTIAGQLKAALDANANAVDPAALQTIIDGLNANAASMHQFVVANTPAAPAPSSAPTP